MEQHQGSDSGTTREVTALLREISEGRHGADGELMAVIYADLKRIASKRLGAERRNHTLQATALVNEAWLRLRGEIGDRDWESRRHFFGAAANAMRRILIDYARARSREKRRGNESRAVLEQALDLSAPYAVTDVVAIEDAVLRLAAEHERVGQVVRLRFYAGLGIDEVASLLGVSRRTVLNDWAYARAWLFAELEDE